MQFASKIIEIKCIADLPQVDESVPLILDPLVPKVKNCVHAGSEKYTDFVFTADMYVCFTGYVSQEGRRAPPPTTSTHSIQLLCSNPFLLEAKSPIQSRCCVQIRFC